MAAIDPSDIAKLVSGYLRDQKLKSAYVEFCKTSPFLEAEYTQVQAGYRTVHFIRPSLIDTLKEFCRIEMTVQEYFENEFDAKPEFQAKTRRLKTTLEKLNFMFQYVGLQTDCRKKTPQNSMITGPVKRGRCSSPYQSKNDRGTDSDSSNATQTSDLPGFTPPTKRRKTIDFEFVIESPKSNITDRSDIETNENENGTIKSSYNVETSPPNASDISGEPIQKQYREQACVVMKEKMLGNVDFQNLIAQNINTCLGTKTTTTATTAATTTAAAAASTESKSEEMKRTLTEQLDLTIENILNSTEKDPLFDEFLSQVIFDPASPPSSYCGSVSVEGTTAVAKPGPSAVVLQPTESIRQRLRPRKEGNNFACLFESPKRKYTKQKDKPKPNDDCKAIEVISNEPYEGNLLATDGQQILLIIKADSGDMSSPFATHMQPIEQAQANTMILNGPWLPVMQASSHVPRVAATPFNEDIPVIIQPSVCLTTSSSIKPGTIINSSELQASVVIQSESTSQAIISPNIIGQGASSSVIIIDDVDSPKAAITEVNVKQTNTVPDSVLVSNERTVPVTPNQTTTDSLGVRGKCKSTPTRLTPSHVRALDFSTPIRQKAEAAQKIESAKNAATGTISTNTSKYYADTPHNRSVASLPKSAPPKVCQTGGHHSPDLSKIEEEVPPPVQEESSNDVDTVINFGKENTEDTVISVASDTPRMPRKSRRSCLRKLSAHKELNAKPEKTAEQKENIAKSKKKIQHDDDDIENEEAKENQSKPPTEAVEAPISKAEQATLEWKSIREANKNHAKFEDNLRQTFSKIEEEQKKVKIPRRRVKSTKVNPNANRKVSAKTSPIKPKHMARSKGKNKIDESMNSSVDVDVVASPTTGLEGQMLEMALQSAKKSTPNKRTPRHKTTPAIKLPPSPAIRARQSAKKNQKKLQKKLQTSRETKSQETNEKPTAVANDQANILTTNTDDLEAAEQILKLIECVAPVSSVDRKTENLEATENITVKKDPNEQSNLPSVLQKSGGIETVREIEKQKQQKLQLISSEKTIEVIKGFHQTSMACLLETPFKLETFLTNPKTPGAGLISDLNTPFRPSQQSNVDDSMMKNCMEFPTPNFAITPGQFTPNRDVATPMCTASNRPTDYSSSSSYYKPDESDGLDNNLDHLLNNAYNRDSQSSTDTKIEVKPVSQFNIITEHENPHDSASVDQSSIETKDTSAATNSSTSSSSSSSSSSDSSSSDSDSSDSSDSETDEHSNNTSQNKSILVNEAASDDIQSQTDPSQELSTAINVVNDMVESQRALDEKRIRMKTSLQNVEVRKPSNSTKSKLDSYREKMSKKQPNLARSHLLPTPSKRKNTQPRKIATPRAAIYMEAKPLTRAMNKKSVKPDGTTNAPTELNCSAPNARKRSTLKRGQQLTKVEESVDAIHKHLSEATGGNISDQSVVSDKGTLNDKINLIKVLEGKSDTDDQFGNNLNENSQRISTRDLRSNDKKNMPSAPKQTKPLPASSFASAKPHTHKASADQDDSLKAEGNTTINHSLTIAALPKLDASLMTNISSLSMSIEEPATPAGCSATPNKIPISAQLRELFGDFKDTPEKSSFDHCQTDNSLVAVTTATLEIANKTELAEDIDKIETSCQGGKDQCNTSQEPQKIDQEIIANTDDESSEDESDDEYSLHSGSDPITITSKRKDEPNILCERHQFRNLGFTKNEFQQRNCTVSDEMELLIQEPKKISKEEKTAKAKSPVKSSADLGRPLGSSTPAKQTQSKAPAVKAKFNIKLKESTTKVDEQSVGREQPSLTGLTRVPSKNVNRPKTRNLSLLASLDVDVDTVLDQIHAK